MTKNEYKLQKKRQKQQHKLQKKQLNEPAPEQSARPSMFIRFAESIKGLLYISLALSMLAAVIMGQTGLILTLDDIIESLIIATIGKILILVIAAALLLYGLKNLRLLK